MLTGVTDRAAADDIPERERPLAIAADAEALGQVLEGLSAA
jgi:hypothetical protein